MSELSDRENTTNAAALPLIKAKAIGRSTSARLRIRSITPASLLAANPLLGSPKSLNFAFPLFTALSASRNACACHAGIKPIFVLREVGQSASSPQLLVARHFLQRKTTGMN